MNARVALPLAVLTLSLLGATGPVAHAGPWSLAPGEYYTQFLAGWSSSDYYHDQSGGRHYLVKGGLIEERSLLSYTEMGWKKNLNFVFGIPVRSVTHLLGAAGNHTALATTAGLADAEVGFRYRLASGRSAAALQLDWKPPLSYDPGLRLTRQDSLFAGDATGDGDSLNHNAVNQLSRPVLGDGHNDLTLALHLGTALPKLSGFVQVSAGYRYRFDEPRDQIVGGAHLGIWLARSLMLAGRYDGIYTLEDPNLPPISESRGLGSDPEQRLVRHRVGPMLVFRVDDRMDLIASTLHTATAKNVLHTDEIYVGVAIRHNTLNRLQGFLGTQKNP